MQLLFIRLFLKNFLIPFTVVCIEIGTYPGFSYENDHFREHFLGKIQILLFLRKGWISDDRLGISFSIKDYLSHGLKHSHSEVFDTYFVHHFTVVIHLLHRKVDLQLLVDFQCIFCDSIFYLWSLIYLSLMG